MINKPAATRPDASDNSMTEATSMPEVPSKSDPTHSSLLVFIKPKQRATLWIMDIWQDIDANDTLISKESN